MYRCEKRMQETGDFHRHNMRRETVVRRLKEKGCRITKQRLILLDIILEEECCCCKEIYHRAQQQDENIGTATVYRMLNTLEEIGAVNRRQAYKILCEEDCGADKVCTVRLEDGSWFHLSAGQWKQVVQAGLQTCGYLEEQKVKSVAAGHCG